MALGDLNFEVSRYVGRHRDQTMVNSYSRFTGSSLLVGMNDEEPEE
jgi:hypothetical protein